MKTQRPKPIKITYKRFTLTAYSNRTPTSSEPNWSWNLKIKRKREEAIFISLGRVPLSEITKEMKNTFRTTLPIQYGEEISKKTVEDILESWFVSKIQSRSPQSTIREEYKLSPHTVTNSRTAIDRLIKFTGETLVSDLDTSKIEELKQKIEISYSPRTKHFYMAIFIRAYKWARKNDSNIPMLEISNPSPTKKDYCTNRYTPSDQEVEKLFSFIKDTPLGLAVKIGHLTGCRNGECTNLKWKDIVNDQDNSYWIFLEGKTGQRKYPINQEQYQFIMKYRKRKSLSSDIFPKSFKTNLTGLLQKKCKQHDIRPFSYYGLRRLKVDTLQRKKVENAVYEELLGHNVHSAKSYYRNPSKSDLQNAVLDKGSSSQENIQKNPPDHILITLIDKLGLSTEEVLKRLLK